MRNPEAWNRFFIEAENEAVLMPGPYKDFDLEAEQAKKEKKKADMRRHSSRDFKNMPKAEEEVKGSGGGQLEKIPEAAEEEGNLDSIFDVQESEEEEQKENERESEEYLEDDTGRMKQLMRRNSNDLLVDALVDRVGDFQEFKTGSVKFDKEIQMKKKVIVKMLIRMCVLRCIRPETLIKEIQRFIGASLDKKYMEPPEYNLSKYYRSSDKMTPILFILSSSKPPELNE